MAITRISNIANTIPNQSIQNDKLSNIITFKNRIINGDMQIDQRNNGASYSAVNGTYSLDRWSLSSYTGGATTGKFTVQQNAGSVTPPTGFIKYLGITSSTTTSASATDIYNFVQIIEGNNTSDLAWGTANAKTVTLSFWARSSTTGTFGGNFRNQNGDRSYPFTYTISAANTWEYKTIVVPGPTTGTWQTDNSQGIYIWFNIQVGSNFTLSATGSWQNSGAYGASGCVNLLTSSGATFYITGVQLEVGTVSSDFEFLPIDIDLLRCQRYYYLHSNRSGNFEPVSMGYYYNSNSLILMMDFPTTMRSDATLVSSSGTSYFRFDYNNSNNLFNNLTLSMANNTNALVYNNATTGTGGMAGGCYLNSDSAYVAFESEL
jgi:hypothetical protein